MSMQLLFIIASILIIFLVIYRSNAGEQVYKYVSYQGRSLYSKVAPFTYKEIRKKIQELGQDYTPAQYIGQLVIFAVGAGLITYLYFYTFDNHINSKHHN